MKQSALVVHVVRHAVLELLQLNRPHALVGRQLVQVDEMSQRAYSVVQPVPASQEQTSAHRSL